MPRLPVVGDHFMRNTNGCTTRPIRCLGGLFILDGLFRRTRNGWFLSQNSLELKGNRYEMDAGAGTSYIASNDPADYTQVGPNGFTPIIVSENRFSSQGVAVDRNSMH